MYINATIAFIIASQELMECSLFPAVTSRAESILRRGSLDAFSIEESQKLSLFFASNNSITMLLKKNLEEVHHLE